MKIPKKFKIGDLVILSAAGKRNQQNSPVQRGFGMVTRIDKHGKYPIKCSWFGGSREDYKFKEYELKRYRGEK
tara:strand:+ start:334 stop:552 length:219 start_codon:yes stop_codon:yes gene_type:complete